MAEYIILVKVNDQVQGKLILTESQYRKIKKANFGDAVKLHLIFQKEEVEEK